MACKQARPRVMIVVELAMSLTDCNKWEIRHCTLLWQQGRAGPGSRSCWWAGPEPMRVEELEG